MKTCATCGSVYFTPGEFTGISEADLTCPNCSPAFTGDLICPGCESYQHNLGQQSVSQQPPAVHPVYFGESFTNADGSAPTPPKPERSFWHPVEFTKNFLRPLLFCFTHWRDILTVVRQIRQPILDVQHGQFCQVLDLVFRQCAALRNPVPVFHALSAAVPHLPSVIWPYCYSSALVSACIRI